MSSPDPSPDLFFQKKTKKRRERECQGWDHRRSRKEVALPARLLKGNHTRRRKPASLRITARDDKKPWAPCLRGSRGWDRVEGKPTCSLRPTQRGFLRNGLGSQTKSPGRVLRAGSLASRCYSARDERSASGSPEQSWGVSRHNQSLEYAPPRPCCTELRSPGRVTKCPRNRCQKRLGNVCTACLSWTLRALRNETGRRKSLEVPVLRLLVI